MNETTETTSAPKPPLTQDQHDCLVIILSRAPLTLPERPTIHAIIEQLRPVAQ